MDVGGGCGKLLTSILHMYLSMRGTLFDVCSVIAAAQESLKTHPCRDRCKMISGNVFEGISCGSDAYLLSSSIQDWDDECAIRILENCGRSMKQQSKALLVEFVVSAGGQKSWTDGHPAIGATIRSFMAFKFRLTRNLATAMFEVW